MFIELVESGRNSRRSLGGAAASVLLHATLISLAIAATASARTQRSHTDPVTTVTYMPERPLGKPSPSLVRRPRKATMPAMSPTEAVPIVAPLSVATGITEISPIPSVPISTGSGVVAPTGTGEASSGEGPKGVMTQFQVDKEVRAFPSNRGPSYPDALRARGIEGQVFARFVVEESGRVDMKTFEVVSASSPAFANAVRFALERARFQPAEAAGHKVPQLVEQHFQFRLDN